MHYPASMKRMNKLITESENPEVKKSPKINNFDGNGNNKNCEADEKEAAKMFPLNIISSNFKKNDSKTLEGKAFFKY